MQKKRSFSLNTVRICIDTYSSPISGKAYSKLSPAPLVFSGLGEMILKTDQMFDQYRYPQAFQERRSFRAQTGRARPWKMPESKLSDEEMNRQKGKQCTVDVVVQSRRQTGSADAAGPKDPGTG